MRLFWYPFSWLQLDSDGTHTKQQPCALRAQCVHRILAGNHDDFAKNVNACFVVSALCSYHAKRPLCLPGLWKKHLVCSVVLQISIPAWYSDDLSQEVQQMSLQADQLVPVVIDAGMEMQFQLKISKGGLSALPIKSRPSCCASHLHCHSSTSKSIHLNWCTGHTLSVSKSRSWNTADVTATCQRHFYMPAHVTTVQDIRLHWPCSTKSAFWYDACWLIAFWAVLISWSCARGLSVWWCVSSYMLPIITTPSQ